MTVKHQGRHPECKDCKHFRPLLGSIHCLDCGAGENFEEKIRDEGLSDGELMLIYEEMERENGED